MRQERTVLRIALGSLWRSAVAALALVGAFYLLGLIDNRSDAWFLALFGVAYGLGVTTRLLSIERRARRKSAAAASARIGVNPSRSRDHCDARPASLRRDNTVQPDESRRAGSPLESGGSASTAQEASLGCPARRKRTVSLLDLVAGRPSGQRTSRRVSGRRERCSRGASAARTAERRPAALRAFEPGRLAPPPE